MTGLIRGLALILLLIAAPLVQAKIRSADQLKADKAYILVQIDPLRINTLGTSLVVPEIVFSPYDPVAGQVLDSTKPAQAVTMKETIAKANKKRLLLIEVSPGTWVIEGAIGGPPQIATSFSLGSYHFEARAGELLDLGTFVPLREQSDNPDTKMTAGKLVGMMFIGGGRIEPTPTKLTIRPRGNDDVAMPDWLKSRAMTYPVFVYGGVFDNRMGGLVGRVDGIDGRKRARGEAAYLSKPGQPKAE